MRLQRVHTMTLLSVYRENCRSVSMPCNSSIGLQALYRFLSDLETDRLFVSAVGMNAQARAPPCLRTDHRRTVLSQNRSTPRLLPASRNDWPRFEEADAQHAWCEQAAEVLARTLCGRNMLGVKLPVLSLVELREM